LGELVLRFSYDELKSFLTGARKVSILAVGNLLRGDDGVGIVVGNMIRNSAPVDVYICETTPENYLYRIVSGNYTHVIIIDSAMANASPGDVFFIDHNKLVETTISTHGIPLSLIVEFLEMNNIRVLVIGIQPEDTSIREGLSEAVRRAAVNLSQVLIKAFNEVLSKDQISS